MNIEIVRDLLIQKKFEETIKAVGIIEATEENYGEALIIRGCAHHAIGNITAGQSDWKNAIERDKYNLDIIKRLATIHYRKRN